MPRGPQRLPSAHSLTPSLVIGQEDARTQQIVVLIAVLYFSKRLKAKSAKGKGEHSGDQGKPGESFHGFSISGVTQDVLCPPHPKQVVRKAVHQGGSLETQDPWFLLGFIT